MFIFLLKYVEGGNIKVFSKGNSKEEDVEKTDKENVREGTSIIFGTGSIVNVTVITPTTTLNGMGDVLRRLFRGCEEVMIAPD